MPIVRTEDNKGQPVVMEVLTEKATPNAPEQQTEITEALDSAWMNLDEALELTRYAIMLIRNDTEKSKWEAVVNTMRDLKANIIKLADLWDTSPTGEHIRRKRGYREVVQWLSEVGGRPK